GGCTGLHPADAEKRKADVGAHDQLRAARLGDRRSRLSLSAPPSRNRTALAGNARWPDRGLERARTLPARARELLDQLLRTGGKNGSAPGSGRARAWSARGVAFARRYVPVQDWGHEARRPDPQPAPGLG